MKNSAANISFELKNWNLTLAVVYLLEFFAIFVLSKSYSVPILANYLAVNPINTSVTGVNTLSPSTNTIFNLNILILVLFLLFIMFLYHVLNVTMFKSDFIEANIKRNPIYINRAFSSFSLGLVAVLVGISFGIYDLSSLIMMFVLIVVSGVVAHYLRYVNQSKRKINWSLFSISATLAFTVLLVILMYQIFASNYGGTNVPAFAVWNGLVLLLLIASMGRVLVLSLKRFGKYSDRIYQEKNYMLLMFFGYSFIAWIFYAGILHS